MRQTKIILMMKDHSALSGKVRLISMIYLGLTAQLANGADVTCGKPEPAADGKPLGDLKASYTVGEKVTYKCDYVENTKERKCLDSGEWSAMGTVCDECPDGFTLNKDFQKCYLYRPVKVTGDVAIKACEDMKAMLAFPMSREENLFLNKMRIYNMFLGITDKDQEGTFVTLTGEQLPFTSWYRNEPNNYGGNEDCVEMGGAQAVWNDLPCAHHTRHYACQTPVTQFKQCLDFEDNCAELFDNNPNFCKADPAATRKTCRFTCGFCGKEDTPACEVDTPGAEGGDTTVLTRGESIEFSCEKGFVKISGDKVRGCTASGRLSGKPLECSKSCPADWKLNMATKHCYKLYDVPKNYTAASADCEAVAGTLTTATDADEQQFVSDLKGNNIIWLGLSDTVVEGTFRWVDGKLVSYSNWHHGEPNNDGEEDCAQMLSNDQWNDKSCAVLLKYVCKVDLEEFGSYSWFWSTLRGGVSTLESYFGK